MSFLKSKRIILLASFLVLIVIVGSYLYISSQNAAKTSQALAEKRREFQGTLTYAGTLSPTLVGVPFRRAENMLVTKEAYETLTKYSGSSVDPQPALALNWDISSDGKTYTFYLRHGVKFYPSGDPFTAQTVKFSFDAAYAPAMIGARPTDLFGAPSALSYNRTEIVDDYTVRVFLNKPLSWFIHTVAYCNVGCIVNPNWVNAHGGMPKTLTQFDPYFLWHQDVTGPYVVTEYLANDHTTLKQNPTWWGWKNDTDRLSHPQQLIVKVVPETATRLLLLQKGGLDVGYVDLQYLVDLKQKIQDQKLPLAIDDQPDGKIQWIMLNRVSPPTNDVHIRRMLAYSFNYNLYIEKIMNSYGDRLISFVPKGIPGYQPDVPHYDFDLDKAKAELALASPEARVMVQQGIKGTYSPGYGIEKDAMLLWKSDLAKIGVNLILDEQNSPTYVTTLRSGSGIVVSRNWNPDFPDPATYYAALTSTYYTVKAGYGTSPKYVDDAYDNGARDQSFDQRVKDYRVMEEWAYQEVPYLKVASSRGTSYYNVHATWVQAYTHNVIDTYKPELSELWKELPNSQSNLIFPSFTVAGLLLNWFPNRQIY